MTRTLRLVASFVLVCAGCGSGGVDVETSSALVQPTPPGEVERLPQPEPASATPVPAPNPTPQGLDVETRTLEAPKVGARTGVDGVVRPCFSTDAPFEGDYPIEWLKQSADLAQRWHEVPSGSIQAATGDQRDLSSHVATRFDDQLLYVGASASGLAQAGHDPLLIASRSLATDEGTYEVATLFAAKVTSGWVIVLGCDSNVLDQVSAAGANNGRGNDAWLLQAFGFAGNPGPSILTVEQTSTIDRLAAALEAKVEQPGADSWEQISPTVRQLDAAPDDIRSSFVTRLVTVETPQNWHSSDAVLCTKTDTGWNGCASLALLRDHTGPLPLEGFAGPREPTLVVLASSAGAARNGEFRVLAQISADQFAASLRVDLVVSHPQEGSVTPADVLAGAKLPTVSVTAS